MTTALLPSRFGATARAALGLLRHRLTFRLLGALAPRTASRRATRLFLTPPRHPHSREELALLDEAERLLIPFPTGRLVTWRWGDATAPRVLLVHGWGGRGAQMRAFVRPLLEAGYSVIAFDAPGHGMSGRGETTFFHFAYAVEAIVRRHGPLAGAITHSFGGPVTSYVLNAGAAIDRVVLIAPPASMIEASRHFARLLRLPERVRSLMQAGIESRLGIRWQDFEIEQVAPTLRAPALVIHDADDRDVPLAAGERYARAWPGARLIATTGLGHRRILRDDAVVREAVAFLAEGQGASGRS